MRNIKVMRAEIKELEKELHCNRQTLCDLNKKFSYANILECRMIIYIFLDYFILIGKLKVEYRIEISTCQPVFSLLLVRP